MAPKEGGGGGGGESGGGRQTLLDIIGTYDNSGEPQPVWNHKSTIQGLTIAFLVVSNLFILLRLHIRLFVARCPGYDDALMFLVMLLSILGATALCLAPNYGMGQHYLSLTPQNMSNYQRMWYIANAEYTMSTCLAKIAISLQYLRLYDQPVAHRRTRAWIIGIIVVVGLWGCAYSVLAWYPCKPVNRFWTHTNWDPTKCWAYGSLYTNEFYGTHLSQTVSNMTFDIILLGIPIPALFDRQSENKTRLGLLAVLVLGIVPVAISVIRTGVLHQHRATMYPTFDPTWYGPEPVLLGMMEIKLSSICASIPVFWPALHSRLDKILVTQEIKITRADRYSLDNDDDGHDDDDDDDEIELRYSRGGSPELVREISYDDGGKHDRSGSVGSKGSETSLYHNHRNERAEQQNNNTRDRKGHYEDDYVVTQVDPLSEPKFAVESQVVAEPREAAAASTRQLKKQQSRQNSLKKKRSNSNF